MRASAASELRKFFAFSHSKTAISFNILLVHQKLCRYKWRTCRLACTDRFPNLPTKLRKKHYWGGGGRGQLPPCPPSGYASAYRTSRTRSPLRSGSRARWKTLFNIVEAPFKIVELWCLCCMMMFRWTNKQPGIQQFWNWCSHYQYIYDWISPLNKCSGLPFILTQQSMQRNE